MSRTYLMPNNGRKSFGGKAIVDRSDDGTETLYSYETAIMKRTASGVMTRLWDGWTATTGTHIKSFCGLTKQEFLKLPLEVQ